MNVIGGIQYKTRKFFNKSVSEKITFVIFFVFFAFMAVIYIYPIMSVFLNSFRTLEEFEELYVNPDASPFTWPMWQTRSWKEIFTVFKYKNYTYLDMLFNSLWITAVKVVVNILASTFLAYAVARFRFPGRDFLYGLVIFSQTIPIVGTGAASYKLFAKLNFINNPSLMWIAWFGAFDFAFIVLYGTFRGISPIYSESAKLDGANNLTVLFRIVMPLAFPSIAALAIQQSITVWNDYTISLIYLRDYPTISYGLFVMEKSISYFYNARALYSAVVCISMIPILVLYACSQKLILTNINAGGLKG